MTEHDTLAGPDIRRDRRLGEVLALFDRPLDDLLFEAQSAPINQLVQVERAPLDDAEPLPPIGLVRGIAVARIPMSRWSAEAPPPSAGEVRP